VWLSARRQPVVASAESETEIKEKLMKTILVAGTSLLIAAFFQGPPTTPPIKMGLWESSGMVKMSGVDMPPAMAGFANRNMVVRMCFTAESYQKSMAAQQKDCVRSNEHWGAKAWSFDLSCRAGKTNGHVEMQFDSPENVHGKVHMTTDAGGHSMTIDTDSTMHYLASDCGSVKPDNPQIVK
jgi:hypothetical protein